jgi:hypothetical protein
MTLSLELLNALGLILPGLFAMRLQDMFASSEDRPLHEQIILALIYSFLIYLLSALIFTNWTPLISFKEATGSMTMSLSNNKWQLASVIAFTILLPVIYSWSKQKDIPMKWLREIGITNKTSMTNTWADTFHNGKRMIQIYFRGERIVRVWPHRYSSTAKENDNDPYYIESNAHGFLIAKVLSCASTSKNTNL